jgi:hypothetical protein
MVIFMGVICIGSVVPWGQALNDLELGPHLGAADAGDALLGQRERSHQSVP